MAKDFEPLTSGDNEKDWTIFLKLCKGCGLCVEKCPKKAITFDERRKGHLGTPAVQCNINQCIACGICELHCPDQAIRVDKKK